MDTGRTLPLPLWGVPEPEYQGFPPCTVGTARRGAIHDERLPTQHRKQGCHMETAERTRAAESATLRKPNSPPDQAGPQPFAARAAVREALDLLGRASADWRNGANAVPGPLHWPVAITHARRALRQALEIIESAEAATATDCALCRHCCGTGFEGDEPCEFCSATGREGRLEDALRGPVWWNSITRAERAHWLQLANSAVPADAWEAYKRSARP